MPLNVTKFFNLRPKLPFRFKTKWFIGIPEILQDSFTYAVQSITLPKIDIESSNGSIYFGNTIYTVPTFSPGTRKIEFSFEENDAYGITSCLTTLLQKSYGNNPWKITVAVTQYDEHFYTGKTIGYICHLSSFDEPSFKRDGNAQSITLNASFIIDAIIDSWEDSKAVVGQQKFEKAMEQNKINSISIPKNEPVKEDTKDFIVTDKEAKDVYNKIMNSNDYSDAVKSKMSLETIKYVQEYNADLMSQSYEIFEELLKENGINVSINAYNDANHGIGLGSNTGSHLLGQKIDLNFSTDSTDGLGNIKQEKLTSKNMTAEQKQLIKEAAKEAGLVCNYESTDGNNSFWGDFALANAMTIDKTGKAKDINIVSWTKDMVAIPHKNKDTGKTTYEKIKFAEN